MTTPLSAEYRTPEPTQSDSWDNWGRETPARPHARARIEVRWEPEHETEAIKELAAAFDAVADILGQAVTQRTTAILRAQRVTTA